jgi:hypothetical protein
MARFQAVPLILIAALLAPSAASSAAEHEPDHQASPTAEPVGDAASEPGRWRCPASTPDPDVLCTDMLYPPPGEHQDEVQAITQFEYGLLDCLRDLFTPDDP